MVSAPMDIQWLGPELDRCRELIAQRTPTRQRIKPGRHGQGEVVTDVDLAIERLLILAIHRNIPGTAILSEESNPDPSALTHDTCAVIDPIDGTDELLAGRPGFAISIAFFRNGRPVAAALDLPAQNRRFVCLAGAGTLLNGIPVALSDVANLREARLAVSATQHRMPSLRTFWVALGARDVVPTPAFTPKFAAIMAGDCDAALYLPIRPHRTAIWDYAAAALLLTEAGGWFGSTSGENLAEARPVSYTGGWLATPQFLREPLLDAARQLKTDAASSQ